MSKLAEIPQQTTCLPYEDRPYQFPGFMQSTYQDIHTWLDNLEDAEGFRDRHLDLDTTELGGIGRLFHGIFPSHYFKVACALEKIITLDLLRSWIDDNGKLCVIDVGCGSGAASCAVIAAILNIIEKYELKQSVHVHFIGVDPVKAALEFYRAAITRISNSTALPQSLHVSFEIICDKVLEGAMDLQDRLQTLRADWDQPCIPRTLLLQVNVVRPLAKQISAVASAYHQIFTSTPMDWIHCLTIGTHGWENKVQNMETFIYQHFHSHDIDNARRVNLKARCVNPVGSLHRKRQKHFSTSFHITYSAIRTAEWRNDETWLKIIDQDNLTLAWARARQALLRDSLADEAEIRLYDHDVRRFIGRLQRRLATYAEDLFHPQKQIHYELPKSAVSFRPKNLSRFEEEILSVAMIQIAGDDFLKSRNIYAHRLNPATDRKSEYLYQYFSDGYESWIEEARKAAHLYPDGCVIQTDLTSYYTHISQTGLAHTLQREMRSESKRVKWFLQKIIFKTLDGRYHESGYGLAQGGVGSGYYANIYVQEVDEFLLGTNQSHASYHRYADDILIVVPKNVSVDEVLATLDKLLTGLDLERSQEKTIIFKCNEFDDHIKSGLSPDLSALNFRFNTVLKQLWLVACSYHEQSNIDEKNVYDFLGQYSQALAALGIVVTVPMLRRKLKKYLATKENRPHVRLPDFPGRVAPNSWSAIFAELNPVWMQKMNTLRTKLEQIALPILESMEDNSDQLSREDSTRLRFCISRLCRIGCGDEVLKLLYSLLKCAPHVLREPVYVVDSLGRQGHENIIRHLYHHFSQVDREHAYMRAIVLRAMRQCESTFEDDLVRTVVDNQETIGARLMASETLLANQSHELQDRNWGKIGTLPANEQLYPQLRKNLILLLRQLGDKDPSSFEPQAGDDPILQDAFEVKDGCSVFQQAEPPELEDFYDFDFPDDAYEYGEQVTVKSY